MRQAGEYLPAVSSRVLANYMLWCYIMSMMAYQDRKAQDIKLKYDKVLSGRSLLTPRWETCVKSTAGLDDSHLYFFEGSLTNAVGAMYAKPYFPAEKKKVADEMVKQIRKEFKTMLEELDWMDATTKGKANEKVDKMAVHIAYAKEILDDKIISKFYISLNLSSKSYLQNLLDLKKFINLYSVENLRKPVDKHSWTTHGGAAVVNAFYNPDENSIQFPAGILEGAFFQADRPRYMNYGAIGLIVGHEITHGFDNLGSQKDGEGNRNGRCFTLDLCCVNDANIIIDENSLFSTVVFCCQCMVQMFRKPGGLVAGGHQAEVPPQGPVYHRYVFNYMQFNF
jgi:predicted metalloendopeptidase